MNMFCKPMIYENVKPARIVHRWNICVHAILNKNIYKIHFLPYNVKYKSICDTQ